MKEEKRIKNIFDRVGCDYGYLKKHPDENLLSRNTGLLARDLLIIYVILTKELGICIPKELVLSGEFATYRAIADLVDSL